MGILQREHSHHVKSKDTVLSRFILGISFLSALNKILTHFPGSRETVALEWPGHHPARHPPDILSHSIPHLKTDPFYKGTAMKLPRFQDV